MSFLNFIDKIYEDEKQQYNSDILESDFSSFIEIKTEDIILNRTFVIKKQEKTKLLLVDGKQKVYLSDENIISLIKNQSESVSNWFLNSFLRYLIGKGRDISFVVNGRTFTSRGIEYYPDEYSIVLHSDTEIDINDLVFVINFIFSKDKQWEEDSKIENFGFITAFKYFLTIDYLCRNSEKSEALLKDINVLKHNGDIKNFSDENEKLLLEKINDFDFSKLL